jgi:hypothetical protein
MPHDIVKPKTGSKKKPVMQLDRDVQVCEKIVFFLNTPCFEILFLLLVWRGVCFLSLFFLYSL